MSGEDELGVSYVVRRLVDSVDRMEEESRAAIRRMEDNVNTALTDIAGKYVTKELLEARLAPVAQHQDGIRSWIRDLITPIVTALIVAGVMWAAGHH